MLARERNNLMDDNQPTEELTLTFTVPETDFDGVSLELALIELEERVQRPEERDNIRLRAAYNILHKVHERYIDTLGKPEWHRPHVFPESLDRGEEENNG
jgi:hypothetical protein